MNSISEALNKILLPLSLVTVACTGIAQAAVTSPTATAWTLLAVAATWATIVLMDSAMERPDD